MERISDSVLSHFKPKWIAMAHFKTTKTKTHLNFTVKNESTCKSNLHVNQHW